MKCTFFGHSDAPQSIEPALRKTIADLIENLGVSEFLVGDSGNFDRLAKKVLQGLKQTYPQIEYYVVLTALPTDKSRCSYEETLFPEELECVLPKFAIIKRNQWMIEQSDIVVTYVIHSFGGAAKFRSLAEKKGKMIIDIT